MGTTLWTPEDTFGTRLLLLRRHLGLTVEDAARRVEISPATWSSWERGANPRDLTRVVTRIVQTFGVDRDWLIWGKTASHVA